METDIEAGVAAGVGCNLLYRPDAGSSAISSVATRQVGSLAEVNPYLIRGDA